MIRKANELECRQVAKLAQLLWPSHTVEDLMEEMTSYIIGATSAVFLAYADEDAIGFAQCQLRVDYVEGTQSSPVGYLEGVFVKEAHRGKGVAKALLQAGEAWAKEKGCQEFASDCELDNLASFNFHKHAGFEEANRIICFTKRL